MKVSLQIVKIKLHLHNLQQININIKIIKRIFWTFKTSSKFKKWYKTNFTEALLKAEITEEQLKEALIDLTKIEKEATEKLIKDNPIIAQDLAKLS